jgi:uncharacterized membrane protein
MESSVIVITPADPGRAYEAQSKVRELGDQGAIDLYAEAVIETDEKGAPTIKNLDEPVLGIGTLTGGLLGSLVGILGGPVGALLGLAAGMAAGAVGDTIAAAVAFDALPQIAGKLLKPQTTALAIVARESSPEAIDALAESMNATVSRWPVEDVLSDVHAAQEADKADKEESADVSSTVQDAKSPEKKKEFAEGWASFTARKDAEKADKPKTGRGAGSS